MKIAVLSLTLLFVMLCVSCADVPDDVISRTEEQNKLLSEAGNSRSEAESLESSRADNPEPALVYDTVENVTKNAASVLGNKYQNIVLPDSIDIPVTDKAFTMRAGRDVPVEDIENGKVDVAKGLEDFAMMFVGEKPEHVRACGLNIPEVDEYFSERLGFNFVRDPEAYAHQVQRFSPREALESDGIGKYNIEFYGSGTISAAKYTDDWNFRHTGEDAAFVYDLEKDDISGISYSVAGQDYLLSDAVSLAEDFVRGKLMPFLKNDDDVKALKIYVFEGFGDEAYGFAEGNYYYYISFSHIIGGIPVSLSGTGQAFSGHMVGTEFKIGIDIPGEITEVMNGMYPYVIEKKEQKELITLESALAYAEYVLAPFEVYKVKNISLEYCAYEQGINEDSYEPTYEYRPMWCLTIVEYPQHKRWQLEYKKTLFIDAIDGTIRLWDDANEYMQFER